MSPDLVEELADNRERGENKIELMFQISKKASTHQDSGSGYQETNFFIFALFLEAKRSTVGEPHLCLMVLKSVVLKDHSK